MEEDRRQTLEENKQKAGSKRGRPSNDTKSRKKRVKLDNTFSEVPDNIAEDSQIFEQPALITGAKLKPYQLEGLQWMVSLDKNGISGILGEQMSDCFDPLAFLTFRQRMRWGSERPFRPSLLALTFASISIRDPSWSSAHSAYCIIG